MAKIPSQWRMMFIDWVRDAARDLYMRDQDACVRQFLPREFHLVRLPVGA